jgi:phospholipid/cholesterol/gamma-HCH transport system substrate-binding protein
VRTAISKHLRDFVAVVVVLVIAAGVGGVILSHQRFFLPHWVPVIGSDFVDYKAEFITGKSLTPGQGQTVDIAGVSVGQIGDVKLVNGRAVVTMKIKRKYTPIYKDATALLRPKTGLEDMVIELTPGTRRAGTANANWTIPVQDTQPDVKLDEVLAQLDSDTRDYLTLLVTNGGEALDGNGTHLSSTFRRIEPLSRDLAKLNGLLAQRRVNIRNTIHNFSQVIQAVGSKDKQLSQLVDSSNAVFAALAHEDTALRSALQQLPPTLTATRTALGKADTLARKLGPTLQGLRPAARALGPTLKETRPFLKTTTPIIRDQLRPFARDAGPTVKALRPAAANLAAATPNFTTFFKYVNYLLNELAYNPAGPEEGYLFWTAWANHAGTSVFQTQDAHGPIRHGSVILTCTSLQTLDQVVLANPQLGTLTQLLNPVKTSAACAKSGQAGGR